MIKTTLPTDSAERKKLPVSSGALRYAPASFMLMAETAHLGNDKHNKGQELHHARGKSSDHADCIARHAMDIEDIVAAFERGEPQTEENLKQLRLELGQLSWRANIRVQELAEKYLGCPLAPGARLPEATVSATSLLTRCAIEFVEDDGLPCVREKGHSGEHKDKDGARWPA